MMHAFTKSGKWFDRLQGEKRGRSKSSRFLSFPHACSYTMFRVETKRRKQTSNKLPLCLCCYAAVARTGGLCFSWAFAAAGMHEVVYPEKCGSAGEKRGNAVAMRNGHGHSVLNVIRKSLISPYSTMIN